MCLTKKENKKKEKEERIVAVDDLTYRCLMNKSVLFRRKMDTCDGEETRELKSLIFL